MPDFYSGEFGVDARLRVTMPFSAVGQTVALEMRPAGNGPAVVWTPETIAAGYVEYTLADGDLPSGYGGTWHGTVRVTAAGDAAERLATFSFTVEDPV